MKSLSLLAFLLMLGLCPVLPVFAGQLEDGINAYEFDDYETAIKLLPPLAEQGNAEAQWRLGVMYLDGKGVSQDSAEGLKWYKKSAEQGNTYAQWQLGEMYRFGKVAPQDYAEAFKLLRLSAEKGNANAQASLGVMYAEGEGVSQDYVEAYKWLNIVYRLSPDKNLHASSVKSMGVITAKMTPEQIEEAQRLANKWKPRQ